MIGVEVVEEMKKTEVTNLRENKWEIEEKLILKEEKVYVPKNKELRVEIIQLHHDVPVVGHRERSKITELVIRNYWWLKVTKDIEKYVERYNMCQRIKNRIEVLVGKLMINEVPEKPQIHLTADFIAKLLLVAEKDVILVVYDRLSKIAHFMTTIERTLVKGLVRLFRDNVWKLYRLSESIISDRGPQFVEKLIKKLNKMLEIEMKLLMVLHLQTDRQMEQINQELEQYLRFFTEYRQRNWLEQLVTIEFVVNNKVHVVTNILPFIANYERELRMRADIRKK